MTQRTAGSRRTVAVAAIVLLLAVGTDWFGARRFRPQTTGRPPPYAGTITIGTETWPGYLALYVARDQGYFRDAGLHVEIKRYVALGKLSQDYVAGNMQGRANLTLDMVNESLQGLDQKAVLVIDYSNGSDAIVADQDVPALEDIRGKRVAYEPNTLEEFFITWALKQVGFTLADVHAVVANPEESARQLAAGQLDVAVSHEPFLSQMLKAGTFHSLYSSADAPGLITDILTFRTDFLEAHPDAVQRIIQAYFRALVFWKEHPEQANAILAKEFGDSTESIAAQLRGVKLLDIDENRTALTFAAGLQSLYGNMRQISEFIAEQRGHQGVELDTDRIIEPKFVKEFAKR